MGITPNYDLDVDTSLGGNNASDYVIPSQKAIKAYVDNNSGGGTATDVQINGTSITASNVANIITNSAYNASSNKIATMTDVPTVNNATLTIQKNGTTVETFSANASSNVTANITVPTTANDISAADTGLSNLSANGKLVIDGQWVNSETALTSSDTTYPKTTDLEYSLSTYLPNNTYQYEVLLRGYCNTTSTSGTTVFLNVHTDAYANAQHVCAARTRTSSTMVGAGTTIVIVGTGRKIIVNKNSNYNGTFNLTAVGYRRIGSNA